MNETAKEAQARLLRSQDYLIALSNDPEDEDTAPLNISDINSPFEVQEYLTLLVAQDPHNVQRLVQLPEFKRNVEDDDNSQHRSAEPDVDDIEEQQHVERDVWLFEHLRSIADRWRLAIIG